MTTSFNFLLVTYPEPSFHLGEMVKSDSPFDTGFESAEAARKWAALETGATNYHYKLYDLNLGREIPLKDDIDRMIDERAAVIEQQRVTLFEIIPAIEAENERLRQRIATLESALGMSYYDTPEEITRGKAEHVAATRGEGR